MSLSEVPLCLPSLPLLIKERICERADFKTRSILSQTSKDLLYHVEHSPVYFDRILLHLRFSRGATIERTRGVCLEVGAVTEIGSKTFKKVYDYDAIKEATSDCFRLLKNRKTSIGKFFFGWEADFGEDQLGVQELKAKLLEAILKNVRQLQHQLTTKHVDLNVNLSNQEIEEFLSFIKTNDLKGLGLRLMESTALAEVTGRPFWRHLKTVDLMFSNYVPIRHYHNLTNGKIIGGRASLEEMKALFVAISLNAQELYHFEIYDLDYPKRVPQLHRINFHTAESRSRSPSLWNPHFCYSL